jgi:nitrous oxidase accessory protein NosD
VPALSGMGVVLAGGAGNVVAGNRITGNVPTGETAFGGGVVLIQGAAGNLVAGNVIVRNAPDVFRDATGAGNEFRHNVRRTSAPASLCG